MRFRFILFILLSAIFLNCKNELKQIDNKLFEELINQAILYKKSSTINNVDVLIVYKLSCPYCKPAIQYIKDLENVNIYLLNVPSSFSGFDYEIAKLELCLSKNNLSDLFFSEVFESNEVLTQKNSVDIISNLRNQDITKNCLDSEEIDAQIADNIDFNKRLGANYTPYILLNGYLHEGTISQKNINQFLN